MSSSQDFDLDAVLNHSDEDEDVVNFDAFVPVPVEGDEEEESPRAYAIEQIERMVTSVLTQLAAPPEDDPDDASKRPHYKKLELPLADRKKTLPDGSCGFRTIRYPGTALSKAATSRAFAQLLRVLDLMHEALMDDIPVTKRDMFYKDVPLFKTQSVVDKLVDDLAATFSLERSDLKVRATSKGLICGSGFTIHLLEGEVIRLNDSEGALIPVGEDISTFEPSAEGISWVLIVEKEAVFQTLCRHKLTAHPRLPGKGLLITGKGYPDVATRQLVKTLSDNLPATTPIMALVDGDAYGIDILSVYKYGSTSMRHESYKLAAERVQWIGLRASELAGLNIDKDAFIEMSTQDEKKALSMLKRDASMMPLEWRKELMHMLHSRRKAEIEILSTNADGTPDDHSDDEDEDAPTSLSQVQDRQSKPTFSGLVEYLIARITECIQSSTAM